MKTALEILYPTPSMTTTEMIELSVTINKPIMRKYLLMIAGKAIKDIAQAARREGESAESFLERLAAVSGGLATVEMLLAIEAPETAA